MDDETEALHRYGTPLEPLDEDEVLTKKPINIEDQIVTDENGKRRFHGAFTGGFSAGFWNTVGSLEGWKPAEFKSSRHEKASHRPAQRPEDFMDAEDLGEFGIAPQRIEVKTDYKIDDGTGSSSSRKRKFMQPALIASGPIPGEPALATLLQPVMKDKIAVRILKSMGWKPGQGIGPRLTSKEKKKATTRNKREEYILRKYADDDDVSVKEHDDKDEDEVSDLDDDEDDDEITFAPDDYEPLVCRVKIDRFGLGYTSLRDEAADDTPQAKKLQRFELFGPLEVLAKNNKKLTITGQGFGVGALEEEDDDIYARDDLTKYDFSLDDNKKQRKEEKHVQDKHIVEGFSAAQDTRQFQRPFAVELPSSFTPRNWAMRRSRFAPLPPEKARELQDSIAYRKQGLGRHDLDPAKRGAILEGSTQNEAVVVSAAPQAATPPAPSKPSLAELRAAQQTRNERTKALLAKISSKSDNFTRGGIINTEGEEISKQNEEMLKNVEIEQRNLLAKANEKTKNLATTSTEFKPFLNNDAKQLRYEKFIEANLKDETKIGKFLDSIQPVELSDWDREMEKKEFIQARKLYKPLGGIMSERFVSEAALDAEKPKSATVAAAKDEAAKKIQVERTKEMWKPHALLCKRYNIAEPFGGSMEDADARPAKKPKLSIFDYLETSVNTKANFQTPVIIPKHIEKPKALVDNQQIKTPVVVPITQMPQKISPVGSVASETAVTVSTASAAKETKNPFRQTAKTELELRVEESRHKPASEKLELFRAIFEDSDDDDNDENEAKDSTDAAAKSTQLDIEKLELPTHINPASAAEVNILRNTSPPRGIFAALFNAKDQAAAAVRASNTTTVVEMAAATSAAENVSADNQTPAKIEPAEKIVFKSRAMRQKETENELNGAVDSYGPSLPQNLKAESKSNAQTLPTVSTLDQKILKLIGKDKTTTNEQEVWIERKSDDDNGSSDESSSSDSSLDASATKSKRKKLKKSKTNTQAPSKKSKKSDKRKAKSKKKHESAQHKKKKSKQKKKKQKR